jgi:hypothetical protein
MDAGNDAEEFVGGAWKWCLGSYGPTSSSMLPHPIGIEIAAAYGHSRTVIGLYVDISIKTAVLRGATEGDRVVIREVLARRSVRR